MAFVKHRIDKEGAGSDGRVCGRVRVGVCMYVYVCVCV